MKRLLIVCLAALALASCRAAAPAPSIDAFFETFTADWVRMNPNQAIATRYFTGPEQDALETQMTPLTREWRNRRVELARRGLMELAAFDREQLTDTQRVSADLMKWQLEMFVEGEKYDDFYFPLEQFGGANVNLPNALIIVHPLNTEKDGANYVARLGQVSARMDEAVAEAAVLAKKRMIPPRFILAATIAQMEQFISTPAAQNPFVTAFNDRMAAASGISAAARERLRAQAEEITAGQIYPAWQRALAALRPLQAGATDAAGVSRFPGGAEAYAYFLRAFTSTTLTAEEIHQIGLREVARLEGEMDAIFTKLGRTKGSITARVAQLEKDLAYPNTDAGRAAIMADINGIIRDAQQRSMTLFDKTPRAPVEARPFPKFREANAAANYTVPARDGSRPGIFQIPLRPSIHDEVRPAHRSSTTRPFRAIISSSRWSSRTMPTRASGRFARSAASRRSARGGRSTPNGWRQKTAGTTAIPRDFSARWTPRCFARAAWSSTRACTRRDGPASRRSITASRPARSNATSSIPARRRRTWWASSSSSSCATRRGRRWARGSTRRRSTMLS